MTSIVVASVADAPGATTLGIGLASAWPKPDPPPVLLEVDPDGGRLGTRLGVGVEPGLMSLALASRTHTVAVEELVAVAARTGDWLLVAAPPSAEQAHSALLYSAGALAAAVAADPGRGWIVDAGRVSARSPSLPFVVRSDHVLVVAKGDLAAIQIVPSRVDALRAAGAATTSVVVVGDTYWPLDEIAAFVGADVAAHLPAVRTGGGMTSMNSRPWRNWWDSVSELADLMAGAPSAAMETRS